jgi:hypothetical protein
MVAKSLRWSAALVLCGISAFCAGIAVGASRGWLQPVVFVTVVNHLQQEVSALEVVYSSAGSNGLVRLSPLASGSSSTARFYLGGDGSYTVRAQLQDGTRLKEKSGYVQPGYKVTETLGSPTGTTTFEYR